MDHDFIDLGVCAEGATFEVALRGDAANVCLMDATEYLAFREDREFTYHGGYTTRTPVELVVPYDDHWFVVIDGNEGPVEYEVTETSD